MLTPVKEQQFDPVSRLMEISFPPDERRPYKEQKELLKQPQYTVYTVQEDTHAPDIKAFLAVWQFASFAFLEHFAVNPDCRCSGVGSAALKELIGLLPVPLCLEAEPPSDALSSRRIGFYQRNGFYVNEYYYVQPPISNGKNPLPLLLLTYGAPVTTEEFRMIRNTLYQTVYHCSPPKDSV